MGVGTVGGNLRGALFSGRQAVTEGGFVRAETGVAVPQRRQGGSPPAEGLGASKGARLLL